MTSAWMMKTKTVLGIRKQNAPMTTQMSIDGSVKIVVDIKEERQPVKKYKGGDAENGKDDKIKVSAPEVVAVLAEENPAKQTKKGSKGADNKESQPQPQKRKGNATVGTNTAKRMKSSAAVEELNVCGTRVAE
jgi:hypothetical protein